jgi:hypothetical protein
MAKALPALSLSIVFQDPDSCIALVPVLCRKGLDGGRKWSGVTSYSTDAKVLLKIMFILGVQDLHPNQLSSSERGHSHFVPYYLCSLPVQIDVGPNATSSLIVVGEKTVDIIDRIGDLNM